MALIDVDTAAVRNAGADFRSRGADLETVLNHVKMSGIEPASSSVMNNSDAVSAYNEASRSIAQSVVQLVSSLKCVGEKLEAVALNYEGAETTSTIRFGG